MRLLKTSTRALEEFQSDHVPKYAILSHTWGDGEVSYSDLRDGKAWNLAGYSKIKGCCIQAIRDGWQYAWIDTCCIDKSSSAELSEAINSMYRWYKNAQVCYVFLSDVLLGHDATPTEFSQSRWFKRGWTLQELLAPSNVVFFDKEWSFIGTKISMSGRIKDITGIDDSFPEQACVAKKMSWASRRKTTRIEDIAYCLMGIFGVNMPVIYGEGQNAFIRLQLEIMSKYDDESLFAWTRSAEDWKTNTGLLASSPSAFASSTNASRSNDYDPDRPPYSMTNKGLRLELLIFRSEVGDTGTDGPVFIAPLRCSLDGKQFAIRLRRIFRNSFQRTASQQIIFWDLAYKSQATSLGRMVIYIKQPDIFGL